MNKLSCLEHLSTLSLSTEMSEMMLHKKTTQSLRQTVTDVQLSYNSIHANLQTHTPYVGELGRVVVPVDETEEDLEDQQPDLRILC